MSTQVTRREFLIQSLAGAGLTLALSVTPFGYSILKAEDLKKDDHLFSPNAWIQVRPDNVVTVVVNKSEMGQGVTTALPMIVADELDADWQTVSFEEAPASAKYIDPVWGEQLTGGSTSVRHMFGPLREAAAAAREMLVSAAAQTWGAPRNECEAFNGTVRHKGKEKALTYGQLAEKASALSVPERPPLKKENQFTLIGTPMARLDVPAKVQGTAVFGIDAGIPQMLYASIARPPAYGAEILSYDRNAAEKVPGVYKVVSMDRSIAVCADSIHAAWKGRDALSVKWGKGSHRDLNDETLKKSFLQDLGKEGKPAHSRGDVEKAMGQSAQKIEATYYLPYLAHVTMEPMDCTAWVKEGRCDIWAPTQNQTGSLQATEKITGLKPGQIHIHTTYLGGGFGRRAETGYVDEVVHISKAVGRPVKLIWTREEDVQHGFYRPGNACRIQGGLDQNGNLVAWSHKIACPSIWEMFNPGMVKNGIDPSAVEGIADQYDIPNLSIDYVMVKNPIPIGFWRSVGNTQNAFTVESFMDELAHAAKKDPLDFRLSVLETNSPARRVLEQVAEKAGWGKPLKKGQARGIAYHYSFGTHVAEVAEISVDEKKGKIKVHRVVCAVDCGPIVNPAIIEAQMRGAITMGLSAGLKERVRFANGGVQSANFYDYEILRMDEAPEAIDVHIVKSTEKMGGIGEPGLPPVAPAVANALFQATGARMHHLPMSPKAVKAAMGKV
jgi:isoquinoline 1-oxidoreductase beta subunit